MFNKKNFTIIVLILPFILIANRSEAFLKDTSGHHRFSEYEYNGIAFKYTEHSNDNNALAFYISEQFIFSDMGVSEKVSSCNMYTFFSYTGMYDFYWFIDDTRHSAPVINRYQNPAVHFRFNGAQYNDDTSAVNNCSKDSARLYQGIKKIGADWFDIGIEHVSNGQTFTATKRNAALVQANLNTHAFMDNISRIAASVALTTEAKWNFILPRIKKRDELQVKWYVKRFAQEADVFWGRYPNGHVDFNDFQRVRLDNTILIDEDNSSEKFRGKLPVELIVSLNIGDKGAKEASWDIKYIHPVYNYPLFVGMHLGPMTTLSDYTKHERTYLMGLMFTY